MNGSILDTLQHPAIIFLAVVSLLWFRHRIWHTPGIWPSKFIRLAAIILIALYGLLMCVYLLKPGYWNPVEASVTVIAQQLKQGRQIYHALDATPRFSLFYGPTTFISNAVALSLLDNPIVASKLSGIFWSIVSLLVIYAVLRRSFGKTIALAGLGWTIALTLWFEHYTYWNKADTLLLLSISLGLAAVLIQRRYLRWLILSLAIGIAVNAKITSVLYFVPIIVLLFARHGWLDCLVSGLWSILWIAAPFVFFPQLFSLSNYLAWVTHVGSLPLSPMLFWRDMEYGLLLAFWPGMILIALIVRGLNWRKLVVDSLPVLATFACIIVGIVVGAHPAAGEYHLIPFIPTITYLTIDLYLKERSQLKQSPTWSKQKAAALSILVPAWIITAVATLIIGQIQIVFFDFIFPDESANQTDLIMLKAKYAANTLQMGYGDVATDRVTYFRPWLYTGSTEYLLDSQAMMDMQGANIEIPASTVAVFTTQRFDLWLTPRSAQPFTLRNSWYDDHPVVFSPELQRAFLDNYLKVESTQFYDVWKAKRLINDNSG